MRRGWAVLGPSLGLGLLAAGCTSFGDLFAPAPAPTPAAVTAPSPADVARFQQCLGDLDELGIGFQLVPAFSTPQGCGFADGVRIASEGVDLNRPVALSCALALAFANFEYQDIEPLAQRYLHASVTRVYHAGSYNCRDIRGHGKGLSEHAFGRAIDVTGFELGDQTVVNVAHDWAGPGPKSEFLHAVAKSACTMFDAVITPDDNAEHHDHLHLDIGGRKFCG